MSERHLDGVVQPVGDNNGGRTVPLRIGEVARGDEFGKKGVEKARVGVCGVPSGATGLHGVDGIARRSQVRIGDGVGGGDGETVGGLDNGDIICGIAGV